MSFARANPDPAPWLEARFAQIRVLLDTRFDNLPEPACRDDTAPGFVHLTTARETCSDCLSNGRTMPGCETCQGRGYVEVERRRDPYAVERVAPYGLDASRHERARERDRQIDRLAEQTRPPWSSEADAIADANVHPYGWELARRRMFALYDYAALERALERLHICWPCVRASSRRGLVYIEGLMPVPIRAPQPLPVKPVAAKGPALNGHARAQRDALIRRWEAEGRPRGWICFQVGLSDRQVREILNERRKPCSDG